MKFREKLRKLYRKIPKAVYSVIPLVCIFSIFWSDISYAGTSGGINLNPSNSRSSYTFYWLGGSGQSHCLDESTLFNDVIFSFSDSAQNYDGTELTAYENYYNVYWFYNTFYGGTSSSSSSYSNLNIKKSAYTDTDYQYISMYINVPSSSIYWRDYYANSYIFGFFYSFGSPDLDSSTVYTYPAINLYSATGTYTNYSYSASNMYYYGDFQSEIYFGSYIYSNFINDYTFYHDPVYWYFASTRTITVYLKCYETIDDLLEDILSDLDDINSSVSDINSTLDSLSDSVDDIEYYLVSIEDSINDYSNQLDSILSYLSSIDETTDYTQELVYSIDSYVKSIYSRLNTTNSYLSTISSKLTTANNFLEDIDNVINLIYNFLIDEDLADTSELDNTTSDLEDSESQISDSLNFDEGDFDTYVSDADSEDMDSGISIINFFFGLDDVWYLFIVIFGWMFVAVILFKAL